MVSFSTFLKLQAAEVRASNAAQSSMHARMTLHPRAPMYIQA